MRSIHQSRRAGLVILLVGVVFFVLGVRERRSGGSSAYLVLALAIMALGARRMRRVERDPVE